MDGEIPQFGDGQVTLSAHINSDERNENPQEEDDVLNGKGNVHCSSAVQQRAA